MDHDGRIRGHDKVDDHNKGKCQARDASKREARPSRGHRGVVVQRGRRSVDRTYLADHVLEITGSGLLTCFGRDQSRDIAPDCKPAVGGTRRGLNVLKVLIKNRPGARLETMRGNGLILSTRRLVACPDFFPSAGDAGLLGGREGAGDGSGHAAEKEVCTCSPTVSGWARLA